MADEMTYGVPKPKSKAPKPSATADAASDLLAAIEAKDATAIDLALTRHYEACASGEHSEEED